MVHTGGVARMMMCSCCSCCHYDSCSIFFVLRTDWCRSLRGSRKATKRLLRQSLSNHPHVRVFSVSVAAASAIWHVFLPLFLWRIVSSLLVEQAGVLCSLPTRVLRRLFLGCEVNHLTANTYHTCATFHSSSLPLCSCSVVLQLLAAATADPCFCFVGVLKDQQGGIQAPRTSRSQEERPEDVTHPIPYHHFFGFTKKCGRVAHRFGDSFFRSARIKKKVAVQSGRKREWF